MQTGGGLNGSATPYLVRDFGNHRRYATVQDLMEGLRKDYAGKSVAVHVRRQRTGIVHIFYVDVGLGGKVVDSCKNGGQCEVNAWQFEEVAGMKA